MIRRCNVNTEFSRCAQRPIRFSEELTTEEHEIGFGIPQDGLGMRCLGDHAHCGRWNTRLLFDSCGKVDLVAGLEVLDRFRVGVISAGAAVNKIDASTMKLYR